MNIILSMIQGMILDLTYTTEQLQNFACISCVLVNREIPFPITYTPDFDNLTIDPDPTDLNYCMFVALKSIILIVSSEVRTSATNSIKVVDGPSSIDLTQNQKSLSAYLTDLKNDYEQAKLDYLLSGSVNSVGYAIITPTTYIDNPAIFE